jgi:hypothetical protein
MTSQGTAYGRFRRAIERGQLFHAELAARELGSLTLADALDLLALIAVDDCSRFDRAALRWHSRFVSEARGLRLWESHLVLGALIALPEDAATARGIVTGVARRHRVRGFAS